MKIFVDMDGVCCNWMLPALSLLYGDMGATRQYFDWPVGKTNDLVKSSEFWDKLASKGPSWWENLPELNHYQKMMKTLRSRGEVFYLTSIPARESGANAAIGKVRWIQAREGLDFRNYVLTRYKHLAAGPDSVLIDDTEYQCEEFVQHGGKAILFPQPWNGYKGSEYLGFKVVDYLSFALNIIETNPNVDIIRYNDVYTE